MVFFKLSEKGTFVKTSLENPGLDQCIIPKDNKENASKETWKNGRF